MGVACKGQILWFDRERKLKSGLVVLGWGSKLLPVAPTSSVRYSPIILPPRIRQISTRSVNFAPNRRHFHVRLSKKSVCLLYRES